jgi:prepilin-type N-terminal cleavage/methylation domain-containing protein
VSRGGTYLRSQSGFTLVEILTSIVVLSIVILAVTNLFVSDLSTVSAGKARAIGLALANEQLEYLRDLPYDSLATQYGTIYPPGNIADTQNITRANYHFVVKTKIIYVDDPYDGNLAGTVSGKPVDLYPYDYKKVEISVLLANNNFQVAKLVSDVAAKASETASNTGILSIKILDSLGQPVSGATIHIVNPVPNPDVDITTTTDNTGAVVIPGLPPDSNKNYLITASLAGYSTEQTYADPVGAQTPVNPNANILVQQITSVTLAIDRLSTLNVTVVGTDGDPVANQQVTITGSKTTMTNPTVYKYSQTRTTDGSGKIQLPGMEWDSYNFTVPAGKYLTVAVPDAPVALAANSTVNEILTISNSANYPTIASIAPTTAQTGIATESVTITGTNLPGSTTMKLKLAGQSDITATSVVSSGSGTTLSGVFNLTGAATGAWDLVVSTSNGSTNQAGGFNVTP